MATNPKILSILESSFTSAVERFSKESNNAFTSNFHLLIDSERGEMQIFDDHEKRWGKAVIFDWINRQEDESRYTERVSAVLRSVLSNLSAKGAFDKPSLTKPFAVNLSDENFTVIKRLVMVTEDSHRTETSRNTNTPQREQSLMPNLRSELHAFLRELLPELK
jgi:hypothetical protein